MGGSQAYLGSDVGGRKGDDHAGFDDAGLDAAHWHRSDSADLVDVLERQPESLVCGALRWRDSVEGFEEGFAGLGCLVFHFFGPSLKPFHILRLFQHVVAVPSGDGAEDDFLGVVADLLDIGFNFFHDFFVTRLWESMKGI